MMIILKSEVAARKLKIMENYDNAVNTVRKRYHDKANSQTINSVEQTESIDQLFVLDFMIDSNQRVLNYLNHFKKHQRALSTQALEDILSHLKIEDHNNIHTTVLNFRDNITLHGQNISEKLKNSYNFRGNIYGSIAIGLFVLSCSLGPVLGIYGNTIESAIIAAGFPAPAIIIGILFAVLLLMIAFQYQSNLYAQPGSLFYNLAGVTAGEGCRIAECLEVRAPIADQEDSTIFTKSYESEFATYTERKENGSLIATTTTLFSPQRQQSIAALREKFARELAEEVEVEYTALNQLSR
ncbi:MAG: hypothetical protein CK423_09525 [Legionella sp.]|nr:MAG: hypothetical protein CK423_09525 [Legionella sp.]